MSRLHRLYRQVSLLVLVALLVGVVPPASAWAHPSAAAPTSAATDPGLPPLPPPPQPLVTPAPELPPNSPPAPAPVELTVTPVADPHLPSLTLDLTTSADEVTVGDTLALTVTVTNQAPDPAQDLQVNLPVPEGAVAIPGGHQPWTWQLPALAAHSNATFTATLRLVQLPSGRALLAQPQATARGLGQPIRRVGGILAQDRVHGPASVRFTPGTAVTLHSDDGQTEVQVPARAHGRALTLQHMRQAPAGTLPRRLSPDSSAASVRFS